MRDPSRQALYCFLLVLVSAGLIAFGIHRYEAMPAHWTAVGPILLGLALLPFPLYLLVEALFAVRGKAKLLAGIGVIARWQVHPGEWEGFRRVDKRRSAEDLSLVNGLWIRRAAPPDPVEVIVGAKSVLIDGSYHMLSRRGLPELRHVSWIEGSPTCLEFSLRYPPGRHGRAVWTTVRIPVSAGARAEALRVFDHYDRLTRPRPGPALRNPKRTYRVCAILVLAATAVGGAVYALARDLPEGSAQFVLPGLAIGACVLGVFAATLGLATFLLSQRK